MFCVIEMSPLIRTLIINKFGLTHEQIITEILIYLGIGDIIANKIDKVTALLEFGGTNIFE